MEEACSEVVRDVSYDMLPAGFEINEGSFGWLVWDLNRQRIAHTHSWNSEELSEPDETSGLVEDETDCIPWVPLRQFMLDHDIKGFEYELGGSNGEAYCEDMSILDHVGPIPPALSVNETEKFEELVTAFIDDDPAGAVPMDWSTDLGGRLALALNLTGGQAEFTIQHRWWLETTSDVDHWRDIRDDETYEGMPDGLDIHGGDIDIVEDEEMVVEASRDVPVYVVDSLGNEIPFEHSHLAPRGAAERMRATLLQLGVSVSALDAKIDEKLAPMRVPEADMHPFHHAVSSADKHGGVPDDYIKIHNWFDESAGHFADLRHRAARHHSEGIMLSEQVFGYTIKNSIGKDIPVRRIGEQHVMEDLGRIPTLADWLRCVKVEAWMGRPGQIAEEPTDPDYRPLDVQPKEEADASSG
jgi:hypothetical protein